jgi:CubicO group peptidase (beta-lactamase class C family)
VRQLFTHTSGLGGQFTSAILNKFKPREGETYPTGPLPEQPRNPPNAPTRFNGGSGLS